MYPDGPFASFRDRILDALDDRRARRVRRAQRRPVATTAPKVSPKISPEASIESKPEVRPASKPVPRPAPKARRIGVPGRTVLVGAIGGAAVVVAGTAGGMALLGRGGGSAVGTTCGGRVLQVAAAPELAVPLKALTSADPRLHCVHVVAADPAATADAVGHGRRPADVWIPDSSVWVRSPAERATMRSVATSPAVLAVPAASARGLGPAPTYDALATAARTPALSSVDPARSAPAQAMLHDLTASLAATPAERGRLVALVRSMRPTTTDGTTPVAALATTDPQAAQPASAASVMAANAAAGHAEYVAVAPAGGGTVLDYPFVRLDAGAPSVVERRLLDTLTGTTGRHVLAKAGFGEPGAGAPLTQRTAKKALATLGVLTKQSRLLVVTDVSGSMAQTVPGAGGATRMDLVRSAILEGLRLAPDGTVAGLWRFSASLTPSTDYETVAPLAELSAATRPAMRHAIEGLRVDPDGGTGLYSTTLAAVRSVRASYDASRVNTVVVLSDGRDQDDWAHGISLDHLLAALKAEADPRRPVEVVGIAYGPDSDTVAMRAISSATGGTLYTASDPRDLPVIFREAIGQRLCAGAC